MATTPRRKSNRTTSSTRAKKPTTIDLDAVEIKDNAESENSKVIDEAVENKTAAKTTSKSDEIEDTKPVASKPKTTPKQTSTASGTAKKTQSSTVKTKPRASTAKAAEKPEVGVNPSNTSDTQDTTKKKTDSSGVGFGGLVAAGLIGSAITLGGAGYLQYAGYLSLITNNEDSSGEQEPVSMPDLAPLQAKIAELQLKLDNQPVRENPVIDLSPIETRLANVEDSLIKSLNALASAETAMANLSTNSNSDANLQLAQEMAKIKTDLNKLRSSGQQLAIKLAALPDSSANNLLISDIVTPLLSPLAKAEDKNKQEINELKNSINAISGRIDKELISRIEQIDTKLKNAATGERLAKSVAINALKSALDSGKPYAAALASLETLAGTLEPLEQLRPKASSGIPTSKTLLNEFHEMHSKLLLAASNGGNAGLSDRVMFSIKSLVTITSNEPLSGDTPEAIISRIDAGLKSGNLRQALAEWNSLPEQARSISQFWADKIKHRNSADQQMLKLMNSIQSPSTSG
ncbi:MAG: hypothetical protein GY761_20885 [Hyphomicrobiales bacterium]|nr:hypothetical protein [Hyphomicrobiales bacterium]